MTRDTLFRIASMTKPITSVAALMLMEEGKLRLDDPITKWMPEFADMRVLKDATGPGRRHLSGAARRSPSRTCFTHRAGLAYGFTSIGPIAHAHQNALGDVLDQRRWRRTPGWRRWATCRCSYPPGERFHYSHATDVLGFLVGRIDGHAVPRRAVRSASSSRSAWPTPTSASRRRSAAALAKIYRLKDDLSALEVAPFPPVDAPPSVLRRRRRPDLDARRLPEIRPHAAGRTARSTACGC